MRNLVWNHDGEVEEQLRSLRTEIHDIGYLVVTFPGGGDGKPITWSAVEAWTRSRAVTVADIGGALASPALDVALCSDLVYLRPGAVLELARGGGPPSDGVIWALGRAGRAALARGLLEETDLTAVDAVALGVASGVVPDGHSLPLPEPVSLASLTAARDLMRAAARGSAGLALELASFRLLFSAGDPEEGARAFLEKRDPDF
jgi:enoyl-CoA hydratase/carnithine racemase